MKPIDEVTNEILDVLKYIDSKKASDWHGEEISSCALKLSILKANLGAYVAELKTDLSFSDIARSQAEIEAYEKARELDNTVADSEVIKKKTTVKLKEQNIDREREYNKIKTLHDDIGDMLPVLQSRLKWLMSETKEQNLT